MLRKLFHASMLLVVALGFMAQPTEAKPKKKKKPYAADFEAFRKHVDKTYPFFDLKKIRKDWKKAKKDFKKRAAKCKTDGEFIQLVWDAIHVLRDGHMTLTVTKKDVEVDWPKYWWPGVALMAGSDDTVIVLHGPRGRESALPAGSVVTKIDGKPARKYLEKVAEEEWENGGGFSSPQRARIFAFRTPFVGEKGEKHVLTFLDGKRSKEFKLRNEFEYRGGWTRTYNMPKGLVTEGRSFAYTKLESGVGYMYWRRIDRDIEAGIPKALAAHAETKGWIVDLRGNSGGSYPRGLMNQVKQIPKPVAVLIDAGCVSAGETMIRDLVNHLDARVFGTRSAGSSSSKDEWSFPSGIAKVRYSTRSRHGIGGKLIEFNGIDPHEVVEPKAEDFVAGRNTEICHAEAFLLHQ